MMIRMELPVRVVSRITTDGNTDEINFVTLAKFSKEERENGKEYIRYIESTLITEDLPVKRRIAKQGDRVTITKVTDSTSSDMTIEEGEETFFPYVTDFGVFDFFVKGRSVDWKVDYSKKKVDVRLKYLLFQRAEQEGSHVEIFIQTED